MYIIIIFENIIYIFDIFKNTSLKLKKKENKFFIEKMKEKYVKISKLICL